MLNHRRFSLFSTGSIPTCVGVRITLPKLCKFFCQTLRIWNNICGSDQSRKFHIRYRCLIGSGFRRRNVCQVLLEPGEILKSNSVYPSPNFCFFWHHRTAFFCFLANSLFSVGGNLKNRRLCFWVYLQDLDIKLFFSFIPIVVVFCSSPIYRYDLKIIYLVYGPRHVIPVI